MIFLEIKWEDIPNIHDFKIIDLRNQAKYAKWHLKNSQNILYYDLIIEPEKYLQKGLKYLLVCDYGRESLDVCRILKKQGYCVYSLKRGIQSIN